MLLIILLAGLSIMLYPTISDYWNSSHQSKVIATYTEKVANIDEERYNTILNNAVSYNEALASGLFSYKFSEEQKNNYESQLNIADDGMMGYIEIPSIQCYLPIYHGTDEAVLQVAVGHIEWTSLPVGGKGTHCVLSGHRGNPSAKLFSSIDRLAEGDLFIIRVLNEVLTYEVDRILTVLPEDISPLKAERDMDYCTLVTCTPYGVNSHRLLVRGHRIENQSEETTIRVVSEATQIEPILVAPVLAVPILIVMLIVALTADKRKR